MQAIVITKPGGPEVLQLVERPDPLPQKGEVRVRVHALGINQADVHQRMGKYPAPAGAVVDIPGLEYAGVVDKLGPDVSEIVLGSRVFGLTGGGAYAQYLIVNANLIVKIPERLSFEEAAAIPEVFITAYDAMVSQSQLSSGEFVLINAVGSGVGTAAVQIARSLGATSIGTSRSSQKIEKAKTYGLDYGIVAEKGVFSQEVMRLTGQCGVDVILELVGGSYIAEDMKAAALCGRIIVVGLLSGRHAQVDLGYLLSKRLEIRGTTLRARPIEEKIIATKKFAKHLIPLFERSVLKPVIDRVMPLAEAAEAQTYIEQNKGFGKVVLRVD